MKLLKNCTDLRAFLQKELAFDILSIFNNVLLWLSRVRSLTLIWSTLFGAINIIIVFIIEDQYLGADKL